MVYTGPFLGVERKSFAVPVLLYELSLVVEFTGVESGAVVGISITTFFLTQLPIKYLRQY